MTSGLKSRLIKARARMTIVKKVISLKAIIPDHLILELNSRLISWSLMMRTKMTASVTSKVNFS